MKWFRRVGLAILGLTGVFLVVSVTLIGMLREPVPEGGISGPEADVIAKGFEAAVNAEAWAKTGAVSWIQDGRREHLWDRHRQLSRVRIGELEVSIDLTTKRGLATYAGAALSGEDLDRALARAWAAWINDTFWLNPLVKLYDPGVSLEKVEPPGDDSGKVGLLVSYDSGGLTPGDRYLWIAPSVGALPEAWRMWTSIMPVQGVRVSWEGWQTLPTGALVSTMHAFPGGPKVTLTDVRAAATLEELTGGSDPFEPLISSDTYR